MMSMDDRVSIMCKASTWDLLLELPLSVIERAHLPGLQPAGYAVEMERMLETQTNKQTNKEINK